MAEGFLDLIETELARALRCVDRACMLANHLKEHPVGIESEERAARAVDRALAIRSAIQQAGIKLPPLRAIGEREREGRPSKALSIPQIAQLAGMDGDTVVRRLRQQGGSIRRKLDEAVRAREPAIFTIEEMQGIMR